MAKPKKSFEASLEELEQILAAVANEDTPLDEAVTLYAKAAKLVDSCNQALKDAQLRVQEIDDYMKETIHDL